MISRKEYAISVVNIIRNIIDAQVIVDEWLLWLLSDSSFCKVSCFIKRYILKINTATRIFGKILVMDSVRCKVNGNITPVNIKYVL